MPFYTPLPAPALKVDGILEGGGALGTAYVGALMALARNGVWFHRVTGNSAGAITASLIAAGYDANEIDWLCAPSKLRGAERPPNLPPGLQPIDFMSFIDFPKTPADIDTGTKRKTMLWKAVKGAAVDRAVAELSKFKIKTPPLDTFVNKLVGKVLDIVPDNILGVDVIPDDVERNIKNAFANVLKGYPKEIGLDGDVLKFTEDLRIKLADTAVDVYISMIPAGVALFNMFGDGGLCKGDAFYQTIRRLIEAKIKQRQPNHTGPVKFRHLPMEFAIIAANISDGKMMVYHTKTAQDPEHTKGTEEVEVAWAVRQSMSLPLMFEPVISGGREIMDGGLFDNYPFWLYLAPSGRKYVSQTEADKARPKLGLYLDEEKACPGNWNCPAPPYPNGPKLKDVLWKNFLAYMTRGEEQVSDLEFETPARVLAVIKCMLGGGGEARKIALELAHMVSPVFQEAIIPCYGFHFLDFSINSEVGSFKSIAFRGWETVVNTLASNPSLLPAGQTLVRNNPYR